MALIENLTSYWALDSNFYDTIGDVHGEGYNTTFSAGKIRGCADLNGVDSYCVFGPNEDLYLTQPFTYTFWINAPEVSSDSVYLDLNGESGIKAVRSYLDGKVTVTVSGSGNNLVSSQRIDNGVWNFICIIIDGAESKFYLNNIDITESCSVISGPEYGNASLYLGSSSSGTNYTEMNVDEFGVWNKVLTENDIDYLYNEGIGSSVGLNNGLYFNGTSDYAEFPVPAMTSGTLECWAELKGSSVGSYIGILELGSWGNSTGFGIWIENSTNSIGIHDSRVTHTYSSEKIIVGQNIHLAAVYNSTDIFLYLNGDLIHTISSASVNGADVITIGKRTDATTDQFFNGNISEIRVWDYPRTQQDVRDYMFIPPDVDDSGLISYYDFKEGLLGDNALSFDGSDDYVEIFSNLDVYNNFVMEFIASPNVIIELPLQTNTGNQGTGTNINPIINAYNAGVDGRSDCGVSVGTNGVVVIEHADGFWNFPLVWNGTVTDRTFISIKYENNTPNLYVDGIFKKQGLTSSKSKIYPGILNMIGGYSYGYYNGSGSEFRLWDRALTDQEIQDNAIVNLIGNEPGLVAYYKLDEGTGTTAIDSVGDNDGLINGAVWVRDFYNHDNTISGTIYGASFAKNTGWFNISQDVFYNNVNSSDKGYVDISYLSNYYESLLYYNGINHYIEFSRLLDSLTWTVELRVTPANYTVDYCTIFQQYVSAAGRFICGQRGNSIDIFQNGSWTVGTTDISPLSSFHLAVVCDEGELTTFINGNIDIIRSNLLVPEDTSFLLGGTWGYFEGYHEELRVWSIVRTQQQIQDNMDSTLSGTESGLSVYCKLDEDEGFIAYNSAGTNNGTIHGSVWRRTKASEEHVLSLEEPFTFNTLKYDSLNLDLFPDEGSTTSGIIINDIPLQLPETNEPYVFHTINSIDQNNDIQINFRDLYQYTIEAISYGSGTLNPSGTLTYYELDTPTFSFTPDDGHRLLDYSVDGVSKSNNDFSYTFSTLIDDHTISTIFGSVSEYSGLVITTESFEIDNTNEVLVSGTLSKGQDISQCVPFISHACGDTYPFRHLTNVYFEEGKVFAERASSSSANSSVYINVVEFNPSQVKVTQGSFSFSGTEHNVAISDVDLDHTFLIFTYSVNSSSRNSRFFNIRGRIENSNNIEFYRYTSSGEVKVTYYIIEALNGEFRVQHLIHDTGSTWGYIEIPEVIEPYKTFLITSYYSQHNYDYVDDHAVTVLLYNNREVAYTRRSSTYSVGVSVQLVELSEAGKIFVNHSRWIYIPGSTASYIGTFPAPMHGSKVIVDTNNGNQSARLDDDDAGTIPDGYFITKKIDDYTYEAVRKDTGDISYIALQFIDWDGYALEYNTTNSGIIDDDVVRSVEYIDATLSSETNEYYKYVPLNKEQNYKYCVPFITNISQGNEHQRTKCDVNISEGPIVSIHRGDHIDHDCEICIYVVEFNSDMVYVEKGDFYTRGTVDTITISGTTSSGVADLNKSILHLNESISTSTDNWHQILVRGSFIDNSTVEFRRYSASGSVFGYYYVVEFLNSLVTTGRELVTAGGTTGYWFNTSSSGNDLWPIKNTLPLCSYYSQYNYNYSDDHTIFYYHQGPNLGYIQRRSTVYSIYANIEFIRMNNRSCTQRLYYSLEPGESEVIIPLRSPVNYSTSMVINPIIHSVGKAHDDDYVTIGSSYTKMYLSEDGNNVHCKRFVTSDKVDGFLHVIDWASPVIERSAKRGSYSSFLNSIEHLKLYSSDNNTSVSLTKNQNTECCIPIMSTKFSSESNLDRMYYMVDIIDNEVVFYRGFSGEQHPINLSVLEFNPNHVKVSKYYFLMTGGSYDIAISQVVLNKVFLILTYTGDNGQSYERSRIMAVFTNDQTIRVSRDSSSGTVWGIIYVVESLDDSFYVYHDSGSSGGDLTLNPFGSSYKNLKNICIIANGYTTYNYNYPDDHTFTVFLDNLQQRIIFDRHSTVYDLHGSVQIIDFKDSIINKNIFVHDSMGSTTTDIELGLLDRFDEKNTVVIPPIFSSESRMNEDNAGEGKQAFSLIELVSSGTAVSVSRGRATNLMYPSFNLIEFKPPNNYYFEGVVKEKNVPVDRVVALYRRSTNELIDSTTSSGTAGYRLESPYVDEHYIVCLDDEASPDFNALIEDRIIGELIPNM